MGHQVIAQGGGWSSNSINLTEKEIENPKQQEVLLTKRQAKYDNGQFCGKKKESENQP